MDRLSRTKRLARRYAASLSRRSTGPPREIRYFTQIAWDFARWGLGIKLRYTFEVPIAHAEVAGLVLREGQAMRLFSAAEVLQLPRLAPYDDHALRMYIEEMPIGLGRRKL